MKSCAIVVVLAAVLCTVRSQTIIDCMAVLGSTTSSSAGVSGDPHFSGFRGQLFEFQGTHGEVYSLFSSVDTQLNGRFAANAQWGDSRTFVDAVGLLSGDDNRVSVSCENSTLTVMLNGERVATDSPAVQGGVSVYTTSSQASVTTNSLLVEITRAKNRWSSCYLNLGLSLFDSISSLEDVHGLVGQTARVADLDESAVDRLGQYQDGVFRIEGSDEDYKIQEGHLFGSAHKFNKFVGASNVVNTNSRKLLGTARALLQTDMSRCEAICDPNPCTSHPDGKHNCMLRDDLLECYGTDTSDFCAPSGCAAVDPCDTSGKTMTTGSCGSFTDQASCDSHYADMGGFIEVCLWEPSISSCSPNPACMASTGSSSGPAPAGQEPSGDGDRWDSSLHSVQDYGDLDHVILFNPSGTYSEEDVVLSVEPGSAQTTVSAFPCPDDLRINSCSEVNVEDNFNGRSADEICNHFYTANGLCVANDSPPTPSFNICMEGPGEYCVE